MAKKEMTQSEFNFVANTIIILILFGLLSFMATSCEEAREEEGRAVKQLICNDKVVVESKRISIRSGTGAIHVNGNIYTPEPNSFCRVEYVEEEKK